jgi:TonB family protein
MPITEVPTSPSSRPPESPRKRSRYEDLEPHELLHVIDSLEDERSRARLREGIWVSVIAHIILFWYLAYGPKVFQHVRVVNPSDILKQRDKDLTYLDLPPDALNKVKPKPNNIISDKDRVAQTKKPTIDKKTLQELQAMKQAGPPVPASPPPQQMAQQQAPPAPQQQRQSPPPQQQPQQSNQIEAPPVPQPPNFAAGQTSAGQAIRDAARAAAQRPGNGQYGGDSGFGLPPQHQGLQGGAEILSDTMGVDFGPYIQRVVHDTERSWWPIIPESVRPPLLKRGTVGIRFKIMADGSVKEMILELPSGDVALDRAAWGGITGASPYPQLPKQFHGPYLELRFHFLYNTQPGME